MESATEYQFDFFLAYRRSNEREARTLHEQLTRLGNRVFLDVVALCPGDAWDALIPTAQRRSACTVILLAPDDESGHYPREEVASAIALAEHGDGAHRVVPVYLRGARPPATVPYGLRRLVSVQVEQAGGLAGVARRLSQLSQRPDTSLDTASSASPMLGLRYRLTSAVERVDELTRAGLPADEAILEVITLKRELRVGGQLRSGDHLSDYRLECELGHGGFATVWKAWDLSAKRWVAVKVLHGQEARNESARERFFRGARAMAQLDHPGIVRVLRVPPEDDGFHYFVMEYFTGGDLGGAVRDGRVLPRDAGAIIQEVGSALQVAHERGLVHRDVKPENVLLDHRGRTRLTDFDLVLGPHTTGGTRSGAALGTFLYAAPETLEDAREVTPAADVFSLAMTAVFVLHGRKPPNLVLRDPALFMRQLPCGDRLRHVLERSLSWEPSERPGSVADFCELFEQAERADETEPPSAALSESQRTLELRAIDGDRHSTTRVWRRASTWLAVAMFSVTVGVFATLRLMENEPLPTPVAASPASTSLSSWLRRLASVPARLTTAAGWAGSALRSASTAVREGLVVSVPGGRAAFGVPVPHLGYLLLSTVATGKAALAGVRGNLRLEPGTLVIGCGDDVAARGDWLSRCMQAACETNRERQLEIPTVPIHLAHSGAHPMTTHLKVVLCR